MGRLLDRRLENFKRRYRISDDHRFPQSMDSSRKCTVIVITLYVVLYYIKFVILIVFHETRLWYNIIDLYSVD